MPYKRQQSVEKGCPSVAQKHHQFERQVWRRVVAAATRPDTEHRNRNRHYRQKRGNGEARRGRHRLLRSYGVQKEALDTRTPCCAILESLNELNGLHLEERVFLRFRADQPPKGRHQAATHLEIHISYVYQVVTGSSVSSHLLSSARLRSRTEYQPSPPTFCKTVHFWGYRWARGRDY